MSAIERLSLADLTNLAVEAPDTPMHQGALGLLDGATLVDREGRVRIERIRTHVEGRLERVPQLRRVLYETGPFQGRPLWVDDPGFRIENHVLLARLPTPGGEAAALEFAEGMMSSLMDRTRPLWELWFLDGYGQGKVGVFLKLHHVFADGPAVLNIISLLFDLEPGHAEVVPVHWSASPAPSDRALVFDNAARKARLAVRLARQLAHPIVLARASAASARGLWEALKEGFGAPHTSLNRPIGSRRRVGVIRLSLAEVKALAHSAEAKVNDVFLDLIAGGLREVLLARGAAVDEISIRASMAVSLHSARDGAMVGNHVGTMIVPLPIGEVDVRARLASIAEATSRAKAKQRGAVPQTFMALLALSGLTRFFIRRQHLVNVLVTNLAGPPFPLYIAGARLEDAIPIPPIAGNVTASFAALSYDGRLDVSVHADLDSWPDLDVLMRGMGATWRQLQSGSAVPAEQGLTALSA